MKHQISPFPAADQTAEIPSDTPQKCPSQRTSDRYRLPHKTEKESGTSEIDQETLASEKARLKEALVRAAQYEVINKNVAHLLIEIFDLVEA